MGVEGNKAKRERNGNASRGERPVSAEGLLGTKLCLILPLPLSQLLPCASLEAFPGLSFLEKKESPWEGGKW